MADSHHLLYISETGTLRSIPLIDNSSEYEDNYSCTVTENYLVCGLIINGLLIDPSTDDLVSFGLSPIEIYLFKSSNIAFKVAKIDFRTENIPFKYFRVKGINPSF
jgi:hypothetical protein